VPLGRLIRFLGCMARRRFSPDCLLARVRQNWSFGSGAHNALQNKEGLGRANADEDGHYCFAV